MKKTPECKSCRVLVTQADAGILKSIPFWYCEGCKNEVDDRGFIIKPKIEDKRLDELDAYFDEEIQRLDDEGPSFVDSEDEEADEDEDLPPWVKNMGPKFY